MFWQDIWDELDGEYNMSCYGNMPNTATKDYIGSQLWGANLTDKGEPYVLFARIGLVLPGTFSVNDEYQVNARISLLEPRYVEYDDMLTKEELNWFIKIVSENWEGILGHYPFQVPEDERWVYDDIPIPDYSMLPTKD